MTGALIPNYARYDVEFERGEGVRLWDAEGSEYLDFLSGHRGLQHRPLPPAGRRRGAGAGGAAAARLQPLLHRADGAAGRAAGGALAGRQGVLLPTRAPRPTRRRSSSRASGGRAGASSCSTAASTGAPSARCRRRRRRPSRRRSRRWCPGFDAVAARGGARRGRRPTPRASCSSWSRASRACTRSPVELVRGDPRRLRRARRAADPRRGPDRDGAHRHAVGLRALRHRPDVMTRRQGPRRRAADRRAGHDAGARRRLRARRPRLDLRRQPAGRPRPPTPRSTSSTTRRCSRPCDEQGALLTRGAARAAAASPTCAARGLMVAAEVDADAPALVQRALAEQRAGAQRHRPGHAALPPAAGRDGGGDRRGARAPARAARLGATVKRRTTVRGAAVRPGRCQARPRRDGGRAEVDRQRPPRTAGAVDGPRPARARLRWRRPLTPAWRGLALAGQRDDIRLPRGAHSRPTPSCTEPRLRRRGSRAWA